jgi:hypothetical protein
MSEQPCPNCGAPLQRMPAAPGCMLGDDCTHGCPACGWHFAPQPDTTLADTGTIFVRVPKKPREES